MTAPNLCTLTAKDGRPHTVSVTAGANRINGPIWHSLPDPSSKTRHTQLRRHLWAKKHQTQAARATGQLIDAASGTL
ncbi:hypothetical protein, partial [Streptomyces sp. NPDC052012]|uniref:hypothetical protein n=1 Tax=Streptomyces sp. NPDC052012 TaxID=3155051 RepID=UPI00344EF414